MLLHTGLNYDHTCRLHILTVYYGYSDRNFEWLRLQQEFLRKTTTIPYRLSVYANGCGTQLRTNLAGIDVVEVVPYKLDHKMGRNHLECLQKAIMHFDRNCDYFMILDSDCFPIMYNWNNILPEKMAHFDYNIAAPFRFENLDNFPHPCAMFMTKSGLAELKLTLTKPTDSFIGGMPQDPTCKNRCFPLLRSNRLNIHPLVAGVYFDMFYHHGAGSRNSLFRITDVLEYYNYKDHTKWVDKAYDLLIADADKFIKMLMNNPLE